MTSQPSTSVKFIRPGRAQVILAEFILGGESWIVNPANTGLSRQTLYTPAKQAGLVQLANSEWAVTEQVHEQAAIWAQDVLERKHRPPKQRITPNRKTDRPYVRKIAA